MTPKPLPFACRVLQALIVLCTMCQATQAQSLDSLLDYGGNFWAQPIELHATNATPLFFEGYIVDQSTSYYLYAYEFRDFQSLTSHIVSGSPGGPLGSGASTRATGTDNLVFSGGIGMSTGFIAVQFSSLAASSTHNSGYSQTVSQLYAGIGGPHGGDQTYYGITGIDSLYGSDSVIHTMCSDSATSCHFDIATETLFVPFYFYYGAPQVLTTELDASAARGAEIYVAARISFILPANTTISSASSIAYDIGIISDIPEAPTYILLVGGLGMIGGLRRHANAKKRVSFIRRGCR